MDTLISTIVLYQAILGTYAIFFRILLWASSLPNNTITSYHN